MNLNFWELNQAFSKALDIDFFGSDSVFALIRDDLKRITAYLLHFLNRNTDCLEDVGLQNCIVERHLDSSKKSIFLSKGLDLFIGVFFRKGTRSQFKRCNDLFNLAPHNVVCFIHQIDRIHFDVKL